MTTPPGYQLGVVIPGSMVKHVESTAHAGLIDDLKRVGAAVIEQTLAARKWTRQRRRLIDVLLAERFSQADLASELGVTRQAIQKVVAVGRGSETQGRRL